MKAVYLFGWIVTRLVGSGLYAITEPILVANIWFKKKWMAA
jgi:hypothetical protein